MSDLDFHHQEAIMIEAQCGISYSALIVEALTMHLFGCALFMELV